MLAFLGKNLDYEPQSIMSASLDLNAHQGHLLSRLNTLSKSYLLMILNIYLCGALVVYFIEYTLKNYD